MRNRTVYLRAELARHPSENEQAWVARAMRGRATLQWDHGVLVVAAGAHVAELVRGCMVEILRSLRLAEDVDFLATDRRAAP